jgi:hypothetical protein
MRRSEGRAPGNAQSQSNCESAARRRPGLFLRGLLRYEKKAKTLIGDRGNYLMFRAIAVAMIATLSVGISSTADARRKAPKDRLITLAQKDVSFSRDQETIDVRQARGAFRALRISSRDRIEISRIQVIYADGSAHNEERKILLKKGERTREINRTSDARFVDKINITYKPSHDGNGEATLLVLGVQTGDDARARRPTPDGLATSAVPKPAPLDAPSAEVLFGAHRLARDADHVTISIPENIGKFSRIRLRILESDVSLNEIKVVYANGEPDIIAVNATVKKNGRTDWFDLSGDRFIDEIQLAYGIKEKRSPQARVEVYGNFSQGWLGADGEARNYNQGWVLLGSQTADFIGFDTDVIPLARPDGGFSKFRVTTLNRSITLNEVRIVYGNGQNDIVPIRSRIDAGASYGPIDVKEPDRPVREVKAKYRTRFFDKDASGRGLALVQVWGHH